jgi:hypothetical protein
LRKCNCIGGNNTKINNGGKLKYFMRSSGKALLGNELAHVVQQRKEWLQPTTSINGLPINDSPKIESKTDAIRNESNQNSTV